LISTYLLIRDYSAAERLADHAIADFPDRADYFRAIKAEAAFDRGDLKAARACLATLSVPDYSAWQLWATALYERNYDEAARLVNVWTERHEPDDAALPRSWMQALTARAAGKSETARAAFLVAQQHYTALLRDRNDQPRLLSYLAIVDAALGRKEEALQEGRRAVEMLPISRDAVYGPEMLGNLALVYSWVGERDRAIEQLSSVVSLPGSAPSYGELKLDPRWDDLRGDPRFQKLVTSTAPQAVPKK
jgi:tetratricopeptide (TPR) repeat protein